MSFVFKKDESAAMAAGQGGMTTGVYKVTVQAVVLGADAKGNPRADFYFADANGKRAIVFGMCIAEKWLTGSDNSDYKKWQEFVNVIGMETGATAQMEVQVSKAKKESKTVFTECTGKVINAALQEVFDIAKQGKKAGQETNDKQLYRTFNVDGKTLAEIATNTPAKVIESVRSKLTPYETKAYKAYKAGGTTNAPAEPAETSATSDADLI